MEKDVSLLPVRVFCIFRTTARFEKLLHLKRIPQRDEQFLLDGKLYDVRYVVTEYRPEIIVKGEKPNEITDIYLEKCGDDKLLSLRDKNNQILPTHLTDIKNLRD